MKAAEQDMAWSGSGEGLESDLAQSLSAIMDGEASLEGIEFASIDVRERWAVYHLIGDAIREPTAAVPVSAEFAARMSAALAREAAHGLPLTPPAREHPRQSVSRWRQAVLAWPGLAVAAAVASVVWIAQPLFGLEQNAQQVMSVAKNESVNSAARIVEQTRPESDYVSAHRQMAGPIAVRQVAFTPGVD
ncbi:MAG: sigma-E factor negative regulatory protein [Burkholderiaceae bacterium]|nr:sigma-E factor negative regulatory protein [Burkholderiaceae bacterium]MCD8517564.1 sigma-E factor negative regulatory protein [Burkholderiaceae bacterium]MCD8537362.1 sigma-E factor negative regulatory protein [Burkholderiaceae bacterium]MCD8564578.1 sigma-E factor negative regulatory protein [Burkholderiaceae bacterium]